MKFKPGDSVAFLNENQNGIVRKLIGNSKVLVEIEDGFEIEVFESELIISERTVIPDPEEEKIEIPDELTKASESPNDLCPADAVIIAALPSNPQAVLTGAINYFIVNKSEYSLAITCHTISDKNSRGIYIGILNPLEHILILNLKREELTDIKAFRFEALIFNKNKMPNINHVRKEFSVLIPDIKSPYKNINGENSFGKVLFLYTEAEPEPLPIKDLVDKLSTKQSTSGKHTISSTSQKTKKQQQFDYGIHYNEKVIDLHIEELTNDISTLTNSEMLMMQLKHFNNEMDKAIQSHFRRIIFIHGVGNGTLKNAIREELKHYQNVHVTDGDHSKYGYGATEVIF